MTIMVLASRVLLPTDASSRGTPISNAAPQHRPSQSASLCPLITATMVSVSTARTSSIPPTVQPRGLPALGWLLPVLAWASDSTMGHPTRATRGALIRTIRLVTNPTRQEPTASSARLSPTTMIARTF
jgi:hypothetical protein